MERRDSCVARGGAVEKDVILEKICMPLIVGALVTWAIYTQGQLLL